MSKRPAVWRAGIAIPVAAYFTLILFLQGSSWNDRLSRIPATQVSFQLGGTMQGAQHTLLAESAADGLEVEDDAALEAIDTTEADTEVNRPEGPFDEMRLIEKTSARNSEEYVQLGEGIVMLRSDFRLEAAAAQGETVAVRLPLFRNGEQIGELDLEIDQSARIFADGAQLEHLFPHAQFASGRPISLADLRDRGVDLRYDPVGERILVAR